MADRVYPSSKPAATANGAANGANPAFPATKAQLYGATRPTYRPQPQRRSRSRSRSRTCCCCFFWMVLIIIILLLFAAIAGTIVYVIYRPHRPSFSVTSLKLSYLNITASSTINSKFDVNITARNPNNKVTFYYNPTTISIFSKYVAIADGNLPSLVQDKKNTTLLKTSLVNGGNQVLDSEAVKELKTSLKSKSGLPLQIRLDTKVKVKMGGMKTPKVGIRVTCDGVSVTVPTGKTPATASTNNAKCKVDIRIKIWKWTI